ncbi:envelope stress induced periplasmic protein [Legionella busanensis]|uniref:Envelope stress induced periplasmic protein n=1 Tax=Legionella busanensis TaxID=190655 RepID=A0A378JKF9_9GAMM|nr:Spy/CpxP family protein refolding chaperone [Legionella busanensis]STX51816.1 envelope stress induced periplasmic protein [Legionella busanensis]
MFTKKLLPIIAFAAFTAQPMFAADSSNTSTTGSSATGASTTDTSTSTSTTPSSTTTTPTSTSTTTDTSATSSSANDNGNNSTSCNCHKKSMMEMAQALQLTDAQKDQMKAIREKAKASLQANKDQMRSIRSQMHDLITSSSMDSSKLDSLISQKTALLGKMIRTKVEAKHQMYMVLNPQQQQKFQQMLKDEQSHSCH